MAKTKRQRVKSKIRYASTKDFVDKSVGGFDNPAYTLPEGMSRFKWKKGKNLLNFRPYIVTSDHHPMAKKGEAYWCRPYKVHNKIGPEGKTYACLSNWGETCPICIGLARDWRKADSDKELLDLQKQKDRILFFIDDLDNKEEGTQVLESAIYKSFGELMRDELDSIPDGDPKLDFWHLEDGMTVEVMCKEDSYDGRKFNKPYKINIIERDEQYESEALEEIPSLDDVPSKKKKSKLLELYNMDAAEEEEDDDEDEEDEETTKKKKKGKVKDEDDDDSDEDDESEADDDDEDEEQEDRPKKKKKGKVKEKEDEDDEDEDDEDEEDEPDVDFDVGDLVTWKYKGKQRKGKITKINGKTGLCLIKSKDQERPYSVDAEDLTKIGGDKPKKKKKSKDEDDDDFEMDFDEEEGFDFDEDEDENDEEEEKPKKKKKK